MPPFASRTTTRETRKNYLLRVSSLDRFPILYAVPRYVVVVRVVSSFRDGATRLALAVSSLDRSPFRYVVEVVVVVRVASSFRDGGDHGRASVSRGKRK